MKPNDRLVRGYRFVVVEAVVKPSFLLLAFFPFRRLGVALFGRHWAHHYSRRVDDVAVWGGLAMTPTSLNEGRGELGVTRSPSHCRPTGDKMQHTWVSKDPNPLEHLTADGPCMMASLFDEIESGTFSYCERCGGRS